jgi:cellobiose phosphorylase
MSILTSSSTTGDRVPVSAATPGCGAFAEDGREFRITDPRTPRPWCNVIANPRMGLVVTQTGSGFSWVDNSQLAVITRWEQDLARDSSGKFLYVRDTDTGALWSLSPAPVWPAYDEYACHHGLGYTTFVTRCAGIEARWTLFCHASETIELWQVELINGAGRPRRLELCAYLEWCCGVAPSPRREFHKLFVETEFDARHRAVWARNHMWDVASREHGHWNTEFPYTSAFACSEPILAAQGDKAAFLGRYGDFRAPAALHTDLWKPQFGRHADAIAALRCAVELRPAERRFVGFGLVTGRTRSEAEHLLARVAAFDQGPGAAEVALRRALNDVHVGWRTRLAAQRIETPEPTLDYLVNDWIRYQAISARLWGRCGYYQQSGAFGFRDQLQDSQVWLTIDPQKCREQLNLHAAHQFQDGSVYHWWHPLSEQGHVTRTSDDLLWLAFVAANYLKETGDFAILHDPAPFLDDAQPHALLEHVWRAFARVFGRTSPRGLPYLGSGDWNDGLSAAGLQERGESIWLAHFLVGLLADWAEVYRRLDGHATPGRAMLGGVKLATEFEQRRAALIAAINTHGWDGAWYLRGTLDDGTEFGSHRSRVGRIYLNAQTWAILNDVAPPERAAQCWAAVREHLVTDAGALLLAPAYDQPVREIGYITRYAPGVRENGGVYTHAATWALAAACKRRDRELVGHLLRALNPALKDPERYAAEPYVLPGNVDGPASPHPGRAGWTWYTGSAQWLHRVVTQWVLGIRPEWDGLCIDPCLPDGWTEARMTRPYRGATLNFHITRARDMGEARRVEVDFDGARLPNNLLNVRVVPGERHELRVRCS